MHAGRGMSSQNRGECTQNGEEGGREGEPRGWECAHKWGMQEKGRAAKEMGKCTPKK